MEEKVFGIELKERFVNEIYYNMNTKKITLISLKKASELEKELNKHVFQFSREEYFGLLAKYASKSQNSNAKNRSIIKVYCRWVWSNNISPYNFVLDTAFNEDSNEYTDRYAIKQSYFKTPEDFYNYLNVLENDVDKAILVCFYEGLWGSRDKKNSYAEVRNLQIKDLVESENLILIRAEDDSDKIVRTIKVNSRSMAILLDAHKEKEYAMNNGNSKAKAPHRDMIDSNYIIRSTDNKSKTGKFEPLSLAQRIVKIQKWTGNPFVNAKNLFKSGQLHWCKERHEEKGKIEIDDFKECVRLYNQLEHNYLMLMKLYFDFYDIKT